MSHQVAWKKMFQCKKVCKVSKVIPLKKTIHAKPFFPANVLEEKKQSELKQRRYNAVKHIVRDSHEEPLGHIVYDASYPDSPYWSGYIELRGTKWEQFVGKIRSATDFEEKIWAKIKVIREKYGYERTIPTLSCISNGVLLCWDYCPDHSEVNPEYFPHETVIEDVKFMAELARTLELDV